MMHKERDCPACRAPVCELEGSMETLSFEGLEVEAHRADDGTLVVAIDTPDLENCDALGVPMIRIWLNDALIYRRGEIGEDLSVQEAGKD